MEAWDFILAVMASSVSVACLILAVVSVWHAWRAHEDEEVHSIFIVGPLVLGPQALIFGVYGCPEAWVFVGTVAVVGILFLTAHSIIKSVH